MTTNITSQSAGLLALSLLAGGCIGENKVRDNFVVQVRDDEPFVYTGIPDTSPDYDGAVPPDDLSREAEGLCIINGWRFKYHYNVINRQLQENGELARLAETNEVSDCAGAHRAIAAKQYLAERVSLERRASDDAPQGSPEPVEEMILGEGQQAIWKGNSVTGSHDQNVVEVDLSAGSDGVCTGLVINEKWIVTSAHCVDDSIAAATSGDAATCSGCLEAYWWDPSNSNKECITDATANNSTCSTAKTVWLRKHGSYAGSGDTADDIGLIYYSSGWNESISEARIYTGTPSITWRRPRFGRGHNSMCTSSSGTKRYGWFDVDVVYSFSTRSWADSDYRVCSGDSGGAAEFWSGNFYLYYDLHSNSEKATCSGGGTANCASGSGVDQNATRLSPKVQWIRDYTGLDCDSSTDNGHPFVRCDD
jgi:hypothetical protein